MIFEPQMFIGATRLIRHATTTIIGAAVDAPHGSIKR
jgi:hypothetical protein